MTFERSQTPRYGWLDYGRIASALAVVIYHYFSSGVLFGSVGDGVVRYRFLSVIADYGYLGVDFFFLVSGFVIFLSADGRTPAQFATSRAVRLYPAFLFCLTLTTMILLLFDFRAPSLAQYTANLTMLPAIIGFAYIDGVYWTLTLEVIFYGIVLCLSMTRALRFSKSIVALAIASIAGARLFDFVIFFFGDYASLFACGCALAIYYKEGLSAKTLALVASSAVLCVDAAYFRAIDRVENFPHLNPEVVALLVGLFVLLFFVLRGRDIQNHARARQMGALTYPLYLLHAYVGFAILTEFQTDGTKWIITPVLMIGMLISAHLIATYVEERPRALWQRIAARSVGQAVALLDEGFERVRQLRRPSQRPARPVH